MLVVYVCVTRATPLLWWGVCRVHVRLCVVRAIGLFDNEEVGSASLMGAGSTLLEEVVRRVVASNLGPRGEDSVSVTLRRSFLVSADMAHALHPNYAAKHEVRWCARAGAASSVP